MIKALFKHIYKYYKDTFILAIAGVVIGVLVGIIDAAFGLGLNASWRGVRLVHLSPVR